MSPLLVLLAAQSAPFDPAKDPAFAKPVTVHLAMVPLRNVVAALAQQSGQPVGVAGNIDAWKATMLVKGLPAGRAMEALADTFGLVWSRSASSVTLGRPDAGGSAEADYRKAERDAAEQKGPRTGASPSPAPGFRRGSRRGGNLVTANAEPSNYSRFDPTLLGVETSGSLLSRLDPPTPSGDGAFAKAALAWPTLPETAGPEWQKVYPAARPAPTPWASGAASLGDLLTAWHDATGLPVVADAFRLSMDASGPVQGSGLELLTAIAARNRLSLRLADGVARLRHPGFWRLREQEVPESAWSSLERTKTPTLDDYVAFARGLTPAQVASFRSAQPPLSRVGVAPVSEAYPALMLWSALSTPARRAIEAGTPVALSAVPGVSHAYEFALREAPYYHAGDPTEALALPLAQLGLFGTASNGALSLRVGGVRGGGVAYNLPL